MYTPTNTTNIITITSTTIDYWKLVIASYEIVHGYFGTERHGWVACLSGCCRHVV